MRYAADAKIEKSYAMNTATPGKKEEKEDVNVYRQMVSNSTMTKHVDLNS
jgi:hypothetical protein